MKRPSPQAARAWSRSLLVLGAAIVILSIFLIVAPPRFVGAQAGPTIGGLNLSDLAGIADWIAIGMAVFGLAWMVRIYRRDPEAGPPSWRFHEWD